jgi:pre-mRNA 3'-end-processing factor FIP1
MVGADVTDYFNYGFDEFTWTAYCSKQTNLRNEFNPAKVMGVFSQRKRVG